MIKVCLSLIVFLGSLTLSYTQDVVMEQNLKNDTIVSVWGQNLKHFAHVYIRMDFFAGLGDKGTGWKFGSSAIDIGVRYKRKFTNFYSVGCDFNMLSSQRYNLKQDLLSLKLNGSTLDEFKSERMYFTGLGIEFFNRFNYGKRGNAIGRFIDIGAYGNFAYYVVHYVADDISGEPFGFTEIYQRKLKYTERFYFCVSGRIGFNRWVIDARYRLNNLFKDEPLGILPELPRL